MKTLHLLAIFLLALPAGAFAQDDATKASKKSEMNVDMPDETEETDIVDPGQVQLETALLYNRFSSGESSLIGQGLLRAGLNKRVELRMVLEDGRNRDLYLNETVQSTDPFAIGTKIVLLKDHPVLPDITFVGYVKLPLTSRSHEQSAYWSPIVLLAFQHKFLNEKMKLEYNAGLQQQAFSTDWQGLGNVSVHYQLVEKLEAFGEYYAQFSAGEDPSHNLGGGLALQVGDLFEIYASGGRRIANPEYNYFVAGGIAVRTR